MQRATLGGVPGDVDLRFQFRSGVEGEWLGTFVFRPDDEPTVANMVGDRRAVLETTLEEERRTLRVKVTSVPRKGLALFESDEWTVPTDRPDFSASSLHAV
jgi:hypothetical protein